MIKEQETTGKLPTGEPEPQEEAVPVGAEEEAAERAEDYYLELVSEGYDPDLLVGC